MADFDFASHPDLAAHLAFMPTSVDPPSDLKRRALNQAFAGHSHGMHIVRAGEGRWRSTPFAGVTSKKLWTDPSSHSITWLLRMEPGAVYPAHRHTASEQCLVLEGDVGFGDEVELQAGDFEASPPGTVHRSLQTKGGCLLLIVANPHDEVFA
jgi:mannose-6-phosphate isomerase-like protein (cupin superfamily)